MNKKLQKIGALAALYQAITYLIGIIYYLIVLDYLKVVDPIEKVQLIVTNHLSMHISHLFMYILFGISLIILTQALYERLKTDSPQIMHTAKIIGFVWATLLIASGMIFISGIAPAITLFETNPIQAAFFWSVIESISNGLGSANGELIGGLWTILVSYAGFHRTKLPKHLNYLGILTGIAGILSTIPPLSALTGVFGISQLIWFFGLGWFMLNKNEDNRDC